MICFLTIRCNEILHTGSLIFGCCCFFLNIPDISFENQTSNVYYDICLTMLMLIVIWADPLLINVSSAPLPLTFCVLFFRARTRSARGRSACRHARRLWKKAAASLWTTQTQTQSLANGKELLSLCVLCKYVSVRLYGFILRIRLTGVHTASKSHFI